MFLKTLGAATAAVLLSAPAFSQSESHHHTSPQHIINGVAQQLSLPHRSESRKARDPERHPAKTLAFFGIKPDMKVVELWPGGGWYSDILAPYLRDNGQLTVASFDPDKPPAYRGNIEAGMRAHFAKFPTVFDRVKILPFAPPEAVDLGEPGSVDAVLTFRSQHNWLREYTLPQVYSAAFKALKPGGIMGVVQHRGQAGTSADESRKIGYTDEALVIAVAEKAGFILDGKSEINANPKDNKDHPEGVWTLPPSYRLGEQDRAKYQAIGESDRMTLRFRKPH